MLPAGSKPHDFHCYHTIKFTVVNIFLIGNCMLIFRRVFWRKNDVCRRGEFAVLAADICHVVFWNW